MLGYLLVKDTDAVFKSIGRAVPCRLLNVPTFKSRPHKRSAHSRHVPRGKRYPSKFSCHHLLMVLRSSYD